jgi:hypothetical protein
MPSHDRARITGKPEVMPQNGLIATRARSLLGGHLVYGALLLLADYITHRRLGRLRKPALRRGLCFRMILDGTALSFEIAKAVES